MELSPGSKENRALEFAQSKFLLTDVSCRGTEASPSLFLINKGLSSRAKGAQVPGEECDSQDPLWIIFRFCPPPHTHTDRKAVGLLVPRASSFLSALFGYSNSYPTQKCLQANSTLLLLIQFMNLI